MNHIVLLKPLVDDTKNPITLAEEALQHLELRRIDEKQAVQMHKLVGGRMIHHLLLRKKNNSNPLKVFLNVAITRREH